MTKIEVKTVKKVRYCTMCGAVNKLLKDPNEMRDYYPRAILYNPDTGSLRQDLFVCTKNPCQCNGHIVFPFFCNIDNCHNHKKCKVCNYDSHCTCEEPDFCQII